MQKPRARVHLCYRIGTSLWGFSLTLALCHPVKAQDWHQNSHNPSQYVTNAEDPRDESHPSLARDDRRHRLTFGVGVGGIWGGTYATERQLARDAQIRLIYEDGHEEPVDYTLWSAGFFVAYEYGAGRLRLQTTALARIDMQSYGAGAEGYEALNGNSIISTRYALLLGPAVTVLRTRAVSMDTGVAVGGVLGTYQQAAGIIDSWAEVGGEQSVNRPSSQRLAGAAGRVWFSVMLGAEEAPLAIGLGLYYDVQWLHADLPEPWSRTWVDQSFGVMLPISTRF